METGTPSKILMPAAEPQSFGAAATPSATWVEPGSRTYWRISLALFVAGFATFSLLYCVQPLLPMFAVDFHIGATQSSLSLSVTTGCLAVSILCAGVWSEGLGRRRLMFASMILAAVLNLIAAFAPDWRALLLARALEGLALGGVPAIAMAYLAEEIHPLGLGLSMGLYVGGTAFGGMLGRVGMGVLTDFYSWRTAIATISVIDLLSAVGFLALLPASRNFVRRQGLGAAFHLRAWQTHLSHHGLPYLFVTGFLAMGVFVTLYNYVGFRLMAPRYGLSQSQIALIFSAYLFGIASSPIAGALADRFGRAPVLIGGVLTMSLGEVLTLQESLPGIFCGISILTIGFFSAHTVASGWVGLWAGSNKGHAAAMYLLAYYFGSSALGTCGGWFWEVGGWSMVVEFALTLLVIALFVAMRLAQLAARGTPA